LYKPAETGEPQDILKLNENMDKLDQWVGTLWVNDDTVVPDSSLFDGATVGEKTSGKIYTVYKNPISGVFEKRWIKYPYMCCGYTSGYAVGSNETANAQLFGITNYVPNFDPANPALYPDGGVNSKAADVVGSYWVAPLRGLYDIHMHWIFTTANAIGLREARINIDAALVNPAAANVEDTNTFETGFVNSAGWCAMDCHWKGILNAGQTIIGKINQNSGVNASVTMTFKAVLVTPLP
jgi:hypothetical protein